MTTRPEEILKTRRVVLCTRHTAPPRVTMSHAARASGKFPELAYREASGKPKPKTQEVNMTEEAEHHRTPLHHRQIIKVFRHTIEKTIIPSQILSHLSAALPSLTLGGKSKTTTGEYGTRHCH